MPLTPLPESVTSGSSGHLGHHNDIHARLNAMANIEVYDKVVVDTLEAVDATTYVSLADFDVSTGASGQRWVVSYNILYQATATAGIEIKFKNGAPAATVTDWTITGEWHGVTIATTPTVGEGFSKVAPVRFRSGAATLNRAFGGWGGTNDIPLRGEFRIEINGTALADRQIGLEFRQNALDATSSTKIVPGSYAIISRVA